MLTELRHALRGLIARPAFTLIAVITLALGIGANTAMFSALYHTLIQPLPFQGGERIAQVWRSAENGGLMISPDAAYSTVWQQKQLRSVEQVEAFASGEFTLLGGDEPEVLKGAQIGPGMLHMLRLKPIRGRNLVAADLVLNSPNVVLISESLWKRRYGRDPQIIGQQIDLDEAKYEIVGVVPNQLGYMHEFTRNSVVYLPLRNDPAKPVFPSTLVRLRPEATTEQAELELQQLSAGIKAKHEMPGKFTMRVRRTQDMLDDSTKMAMNVLLGAVGFVLLIGCANLAGLLLVRLGARRREIAIRAALGAGRLRIMRHLWVEALVLAIAGAGMGVLLATWGVDLVRALRPDNLGSLDAMVVDGPTLFFAAALAVFAAFLFGTAPALTVLRGDLAATIATSGGAGSRVTEGGRLRTVLVAGEIALSVVLLVGAGLLVRTMQKIEQRPLGFSRQQVLVAEIQLPDARYASPDARKAFATQLLSEVRALPGVTSAAMSASSPPQLGMMFVGALEVQGKPDAGKALGSALQGTLVDPEFFETMGIRVLRGRVWTGNDQAGMVINETMAKQLWPGEDAVGKFVRSQSGGPETPPWEQIIAVVNDIAGGSVRSPANAQVYNRMAYGWREMSIVVRTNVQDPATLIPAVKRALQHGDPALPLRKPATMEAKLADMTAQQRFNMALLSVFAGLAFVLSLIGLYGVISHTVTRRSPEIGVRLALGASPRTILQMVLGEGLRLTAAGLVIGGLAAVALTRVLSGLLYGVRPRDPLTFAAALVLLGCGSLIACWIPARRATTVDPLVVLRAE